MDTLCVCAVFTSAFHLLSQSKAYISITAHWNNFKLLMNYFEKIHNFKMWSDLTLKLGHIWQRGQTHFKHHFSKNRLADLFHAWFKWKPLIHRCAASRSFWLWHNLNVKFSYFWHRPEFNGRTRHPGNTSENLEIHATKSPEMFLKFKNYGHASLKFFHYLSVCPLVCLYVC